MLGGSGADQLWITGTGTKVVSGDGIADGGTAGADTYLILGGTNNRIMDYQAGEDVVLRASSEAAISTQLVGITIGPTAYYAALVTDSEPGFTSSTFVVFGTQSMGAAAAQAEYDNFIDHDLFVSSTLIA
jgi:autotransporter adhesin